MYNDQSINGSRQPLKLRWLILAYLITALAVGTFFTVLRGRHHKTIKLQWIVSTTVPVQYNIYRATGEGEFVKIGSSPYPQFEDKTAEPGHVYKYYTRAEDVYGKESAPSNAVIIGLPE